MRRVMIIGATSAIAKGLAYVFAAEGACLYLAGRDRTDLSHIAADLFVRYGAKVLVGHLDADDLSGHRSLISEAIGLLGGLDDVIVCLGHLGEQKQGEADFKDALPIINRNYAAVVSLVTPVVNYFEGRKKGSLVVLSSVAGDRGRQSNYLYGSAKAGLTAFLSGLRNRLAKSRVQVLTVKLGFVDTAMTYGLPGLFLMASPQKIAVRIRRAMVRKRDVVYLPWFWQGIMFIIRNIPEKLFKRLSL